MMASLPAYIFHLLIFLFASLAEANDPQTIYLVRMKLGSHGYVSRPGHQALLTEVLDEDRPVADSLIYSYTHSFTGFAARLTETEREKLERRREVLSVLPSRELKLQTTRSWDFIDLPLTVERKVASESEMVVAVLDSGIQPHHKTFSDEGMSSAPSGWKNKCDENVCNKKIIGARSYYSGNLHHLAENKSVMDSIGHGTHVASIVAGRETADASFFGLAKGTMRGGVPNARIAVYKTCWKVHKPGEKDPVSVCPESDTLMAIDDAIKDKVDIISYSQGDSVPLNRDNIAWAFLKATDHGILTSAAAGNDGAYRKVVNGAPWILTVGASDTDRKFETTLELKNAVKLRTMNTINPFETQDAFYSLLEESLGRSATIRDVIQSREGLALPDRMNYKAKDVFFNLSKLEQVKTLLEENANGLIVNGTIWGHNCQFPLPSVCLTRDEAEKVKEYAKENRDHSAKIHKSEDVFPPDNGAPRVANFSSKGPNSDQSLASVLKPDITAPGVDILAGWSTEIKLIPEFPQDKRASEYNLQSGTSMACPHATAVALYLKSFNPKWSPGAIKSALMTTSRPMRRREFNKEFGFGAGNLNASSVLNPGLIYDTQAKDYIEYLCRHGYSTEELKSLAGMETVDCSKAMTTELADYLNYPTMLAKVDINTSFKKVFYRTVTNVGSATSTYDVKDTILSKNTNFKVIVEPQRLSFNSLGEKKHFKVEVSGTLTSKLGPQMWVTWKDEKHIVRSPIVIHSL